MQAECVGNAEPDPDNWLNASRLYPLSLKGKMALQKAIAKPQKTCFGKFKVEYVLARNYWTMTICQNLKAMTCNQRTAWQCCQNISKKICNISWFGGNDAMSINNQAINRLFFPSIVRQCWKLAPTSTL